MKRQVRDCDGCLRDDIGPTDAVPPVLVNVPRVCAESEGQTSVDLCPRCLARELETLLAIPAASAPARGAAWALEIRERGYAARRRVRKAPLDA